MLFRYLAARLRYGKGAAGGRFLRSGLSLEARGRDLSDSWSPHHDRSKAAQRRWAHQDLAAGMIDLAVPGAGRLADFDSAAFEKRFKRWLLIDADPSSQAYWLGLGVDEVDGRIGDLTGVMDPWLARLAHLRGDWRETLAGVRAIAAPGDRPMAFAADAVLSLNVLSQLPIAWQDGVEAHLRRRFGTRQTQEHEEEWLAAVDAGGSWIVRQHLIALTQTRARSILLLTDLEYAEYRGGPAPTWENGEWRAGPGLRVDVFPALYGVDLALSGYRLLWEDSWLWHISPIDRESREYGTMHRVGAFAFSVER